MLKRDILGVKMAYLSGHGKGKWQNDNSFRRYKMKRKRLDKIAKESRKRNR